MLNIVLYRKVVFILSVHMLIIMADLVIPKGIDYLCSNSAVRVRIERFRKNELKDSERNKLEYSEHYQHTQI